MSTKIISNSLIKLIASILFLLVLGRFYQFAFIEPPFRSFLLNTRFMAPFIEGVLNIEWNDWVTNPIYEKRVDILISIIAVFLGLVVIILPFYENKFIAKVLAWILPLTSIVLLITSFGYYWDKSTQIGQFWEYSIQFGLPVIFLLSLKGKTQIVWYLSLIFTSLTFAAHGLYAVGFYPVPGDFVHMTSRLLSITDDPAKQFLYVAGMIDFIFAIAIWIPKIRNAALLYGAFWGFITALARLIAFYYHDFAMISLHQSVFEMLVRLCHGGLPLFLFFQSSEKSFSLSFPLFFTTKKILLKNDK